jgi:hypothetical protein
MIVPGTVANVVLSFAFGRSFDRGLEPRYILAFANLAVLVRTLPCRADQGYTSAPQMQRACCAGLGLRAAAGDSRSAYDQHPRRRGEGLL